jgi:hypothetical protein
MSDIFNRVLRESKEYVAVLKSQSTQGVDFSDQKSLDTFHSNTMRAFKEGKSQLDLDLIYVTYYDQWKRG